MDLLIKIARGYLSIILLVAAVLTVPIMVALVYYLVVLLAHLIGFVFFP